MPSSRILAALKMSCPRRRSGSSRQISPSNSRISGIRSGSRIKVVFLESCGKGPLLADCIRSPPGCYASKASPSLYAGKRGNLASSTASLNAVSHAAHCSGDAWPSTVMPDGSTDASKHGLPKESLKNPIESGRAPGNPRSTLPHVVYSASVRHPMVMVYVPPIFTNGLASRSCSFQGWNHPSKPSTWSSVVIGPFSTSASDRIQPLPTRVPNHRAAEAPRPPLLMPARCFAGSRE
jgi:hypothetical protein